ncbi:MAG: Alginate regulatory protein AlgP [uncultured Paraburkholderia sp.]|nr:MAG: Alginate regulatory protein AlgP [uncultured Paraburkholderia sp.]CAH2918381.1 MAG: Alginate regulatory protein AlgP [uncultured Paraburkholderia sp.]
MTDTPDSTPPFPGFPGFPPAEMLERMWGMMRLSPFGSAFPSAQPAAGFGPSLSMMSDMMAPLTNVEEIDKRITDMRAVEQWLKLNLSMLQSAIQALEVQRATLATLRAFGAFAQQSMSQPSAAAESGTAGSSPLSGWPHTPAASVPPSAEPEPKDDDKQADAAATPPFDASAWWNLLQTQFNQIVQFAMTQPGVAAATAGGGTQSATGAEPEAGEAAEMGESSGSASSGEAASTRCPSAEPAAKRASSTTKRTSSMTARTAKKSL